MMGLVQAKPPGSEPLIRGRTIMELLAHMNEFQPNLEGRVRARVGDENMSRFDGMLPTDWVPTSYTRPLIDALVVELGERTPELWSSLVCHRLFNTPLLGGLFDMISRLSGISPARLLKTLPRAWNNAYKGWATVRVVMTEDGAATVEFANVAPYLFEHRQHWLAIRGVLEGLVKLAKHTGHATLRYDPDASRVEARVQWGA